MTKSSQKNVLEVGVDLGVACIQNSLIIATAPSFKIEYFYVDYHVNKIALDLRSVQS